MKCLVTYVDPGEHIKKQRVFLKVKSITSHPLFSDQVEVIHEVSTHDVPDLVYNYIKIEVFP